MMNWEYELHVPPHSADGQWRVIDAESDSGDVVAIIDPNDIAEELGKSPEEYARLMAAAPKMRALLHSLVADIDAMDQGEQMFGPFSEFVDWPLGMGVSWPNLAILRDEAKKLLAGGA